MPPFPFRRPVSRRSFLGGSLALSASLPAGGLFAGGNDSIRVGVVGCGGRGTGAALQAAAADRGVVVTAIGDLFADQAATSAAILAGQLGRRFACPAERRFFGVDAGLEVIGSDVDVVILATPPHLRPAHVAAAVAAGRHLSCETPAAVDAAGVRSILATATEARLRGLSLVAGLAARRDGATAATIDRVRRGDIGRPLRGVVDARLGLAWRRTPLASWTPAEDRDRNWIMWPAMSGGDFVEHLVPAIDRAFWAFGDEQPVAAVPRPSAVALPSRPVGRGESATAVTFVFADGRTLDAAVERRAGIATGTVERILGSGGEADLRRHVVAGMPAAGATLPAACPVDGLAASVAALVRAVRSGTRIDDADILCRATLAAILGRTAAGDGREVAWEELAGGDGCRTATTDTV
ncbi:MAG: Gfo/Idh/MocA family oxidoreductase [Pirellulales bacterium]